MNKKYKDKNVKQTRIVLISLRTGSKLEIKKQRNNKNKLRNHNKRITIIKIGDNQN